MAKIFRLHPVIHEAYLAVHKWLAGLPAANDYLDIGLGQMKLDSPDMKHIAAQFALLFHAHHFKSSFIFDEILTHEELVSWLRQNQHITLIDMGCGAGAASAALIAALIELKQLGRIRHEVTLVCIGVDLVDNVLGIYNKLLEILKGNISRFGIRLEIRVVDRPASESVTDLDEHLRILLKGWNQPALTQVVIAQSNIIRPLSSLFEETQERKERLNELGIPSDRFISEDAFGMREVRSYRQLFTQLPVDNLHVLTVGTNQDHWIRRTEAIGDALADLFSGHEVKSYGTCLHRIDFVNPEGSHWRARENETIRSKTKFVTDVRTVENTGLRGDLDWHRVIAYDNLELAWARARALQQREVLYDEVEIRLFERNLCANLNRLRRELLSYETAVARTCDRINFRFVKNEADEAGRPRVLARIEEEIVSIAIVQELGAAAFGLNATSYAYRPNPRFASRSEFLYDYWFRAYQRYKDDAQNTVAKYPECKVWNIDIKSYFMDIPQQRLIESVQKEVRTRSSRISWLLQRLLVEELHEHKEGRGLTQGGAGSGFYANAYLVDLDSKFGVNNEWDAHVYRFVDDVIIVVPDAAHFESAKEVAKVTLRDLQLELNQSKSECFTQQQYLNLPKDDGKMEGLSKRFNLLAKPLWRTNDDILEQLRIESRWWETIGVYRDHLQSIGHYMEPHRLSRKVNQFVEKYIHDQEEEDKKFEIELPPLDDPDWANAFNSANDSWLKGRECLRADLISLAETSYNLYENEECDKKKRLMSTRIYFSANRLASLGFGNSAELFTRILKHQPWIVRQPQYVIRGLAIQGYSDLVGQLFDKYSQLDRRWSGSLLAVVVRAIRHLDDVPDTLEEGIVQIALDDCSDDILRLLATETWLMKFDCKHVRRWMSRIQEIAKDEQCSRVRKNFLLLLGKCVSGSVEPHENQDPLLDRAMEIALEGNIDGLFDYVEPDVLRERYYSRSYPDFIDFDDDAPS